MFWKYKQAIVHDFVTDWYMMTSIWLLFIGASEIGSGVARPSWKNGVRSQIDALGKSDLYRVF